MLIASSVIEAVVTHAQEARPLECCGVLIGKADRIEEAVRARNVAASASRFLLDPKSHIEARRTARSRGLEVVGFYHSHPHSQALPSSTDLAEAAYPECVHLIVGFVGDRPEVRLFNYRHGHSTELPQVFVNVDR
jgi:proteasome lid subunit RPN8/RPN11